MFHAAALAETVCVLATPRAATGQDVVSCRKQTLVVQHQSHALHRLKSHTSGRITFQGADQSFVSGKIAVDQASAHKNNIGDRVGNAHRVAIGCD